MADPYEVTIAPRARRDLRKLPEKVATACVEFVAGPLRDNPQRVGKPLIGELAGSRSARRGSYRIVYSIDEDARRILIEHIDHRSSVYR